MRAPPCLHAAVWKYRHRSPVLWPGWQSANKCTTRFPASIDTFAEAPSFPWAVCCCWGPIDPAAGAVGAAAASLPAAASFLVPAVKGAVYRPVCVCARPIAEVLRGGRKQRLQHPVYTAGCVRVPAALGARWFDDVSLLRAYFGMRPLRCGSLGRELDSAFGSIGGGQNASTAACAGLRWATSGVAFVSSRAHRHSSAHRLWVVALRHPTFTCRDCHPRTLYSGFSSLSQRRGGRAQKACNGFLLTRQGSVVFVAGNERAW